MLSILTKIPQGSHEALADWFKKKKQAGRKAASSIGLWSEIWRKRVLEWDQHVIRSADRDSILAVLRHWHDSAWLQQQRLAWVSDRGGRNTPFAGRLGTRAYSAQPQPRWEEGIVLAEQVGNTREFNHFGSARISIGTRIREAQSFLRQFFSAS